MNRRPTLALTVVTALALITTACADSSPSVRGALSSGEVAIAADDVPDDLRRCDYSGTVPAYLATIRGMSSENYERSNILWGQILDAGAIEGQMSVYAESSRICRYWITGPPAGSDHDVMRLISSIVIRFPDVATAEAAFAKKIFGQDKVVGAEGFRVEQGDATGLGANSVIAIEGDTPTGAAQAVWQRGPFNVFLATRHLTRPEVDAALRAVDERAQT